ncbi:ComEC/Rec2 family competence protein [Verrucomicrobiota bacterium]
MRTKCPPKAISSKLPIRRPLVGLVFCYMLGTWLAFSFEIPPSCVVTAAVSFLLLASILVYVTPWKACSSLILYVCVVLAAWSAVLVHPLGVSATRKFGRMLEEKVIVTGIVAGDPIGRPMNQKQGIYMWKFPLRIEETKTGQQVCPGNEEEVSVFWYGYAGNRKPDYGERWRISGIIKQRVYDGEIRRIHGLRDYCLNASWRDSRFLSGGHGNWFVKQCFSMRKSAATYLSVGIEDCPDTAGFLHAVLLGYRGQISEDMREVFLSTATLHIFAISGLHVGIIAGIIIFVLTALRISRVYWVLFLAPLLIAYTIATGARASAVRACVMAIVYFSAPLIGRKADSFSSLAFAALLILAVAPGQLFDMGFVYSFAVVVGLILMFPVFERPMRRFYEKDPLRLQPESKWITGCRVTARYISSLLALSISAWLVSAPLTMYFFGRFTPIAFVSNLIVIPLAFLVVLSGCLSLVLGSCIALFAHIFNHANLALVSILTGAMRLMAGIPFGSIEVKKPSLWIILLCYACLTAIIFTAKTMIGYSERDV